MITIINHLSENYADAIRSSCREQKCNLDLTGLSNYLILDGEKIGRQPGGCDCIIVMHKGRNAALVELKSTSLDTTRVIKQLQNSADALAEALYKFKDSITVHFILLSKAGKAIEYKILRSHKIKFRGHKYAVKRARCGAKLDELC